MKKFFIYKIIIISLFIFFSQQQYNEEMKHYENDLYDDTDRDDNDNNLEFCKNEGPLYEYIYYIYEKTHNFNTWVNKDNAHYLVEMAKYWNCYKTEKDGKIRSNCKNKYNESYYKYLNRLGPYFFFVAFAGVVFFTWILLWVCMIHPKCCCKESINERYIKYISLIIVLICLGGIFACIISSFVYSHRWNNRLNGITCSIERLYYNMYHGQKNYREGCWRGFNGLYYVYCNNTQDEKCKNNKTINYYNKINGNNFIEDKKNFRLLNEKESLIKKNNNDISNIPIKNNSVDEEKSNLTLSKCNIITDSKLILKRILENNQLLDDISNSLSYSLSSSSSLSNDFSNSISDDFSSSSKLSSHSLSSSSLSNEFCNSISEDFSSSSKLSSHSLSSSSSLSNEFCNSISDDFSSSSKLSSYSLSSSSSLSNDFCNSISDDFNSKLSYSSSSSSSDFDSSNSNENLENELVKYILDIDDILNLANSFKELKPKLFNTYYKVRRVLKGLGYYSYFVIYSVFFVIITLLVLPQVFFVFYPTAKCKHYNRILLIVGWNCIMLFTLYSFFLTAFLGMVDYASTDMIGFFSEYFKPQNLLYEFFSEKRPFLIPNDLTGEILFVCLYATKDTHILNHKFHYLGDRSQNFDYYKNLYNNYIDIYYKNLMNENENNKEYNIDEKIINKNNKNNLRNLGQIEDPDWEDDIPDYENTKCSYLRNDINMLYTTFLTFSKMDRNLVAITATISFLGYICAIFMVITIKQFDGYWKEKGKYNYDGNDNDNDNSSSDGSSENNVKKNDKKKIGNYIKINENLKKNLIDPNTIHKSKKSLDNNINNNINNEEDKEEEEDEE